MVVRSVRRAASSGVSWSVELAEAVFCVADPKVDLQTALKPHQCVVAAALQDPTVLGVSE